MAKNPLPSPELLRQLLRYEPDTGKLFWRKRTEAMEPRKTVRKMFNTRFAETEALNCRMPCGHLQGRINRSAFLAHRVIWVMVHGSLPSGDIDHIDGDPFPSVEVETELFGRVTRVTVDALHVRRAV